MHFTYFFIILLFFNSDVGAVSSFAEGRMFSVKSFRLLEVLRNKSLSQKQG